MSGARYGLPAAAIKQLCAVFTQWPNIDAVLLYGSRAKGNYHSGSDIDLSIKGEGLTFSDLLAIENEIDDLLLPWSVDLSLLGEIDTPSLVEHIQRVGVLFYERGGDGVAS